MCSPVIISFALQIYFRKFFSMHFNPANGGRKQECYFTKNRFARDGRDIFWISDVPHLLKVR